MTKRVIAERRSEVAYLDKTDRVLRELTPAEQQRMLQLFAEIDELEQLLDSGVRSIPMEQGLRLGLVSREQLQ